MRLRDELAWSWRYQRTETVALAFVVLMLLVGLPWLVVAAKHDLDEEQAHVDRGDRCVRVRTVYVHAGNVMVPVESCGEWAPRGGGR